MKVPSYQRLYLHIGIWVGHKPWVDSRHLRLGNFVRLASRLTSPTKVGSRNLISLAPTIVLLFSLSAYIYILTMADLVSTKEQNIITPVLTFLSYLMVFTFVWFLALPFSSENHGN